MKKNYLKELLIVLGIVLLFFISRYHSISINKTNEIGEEAIPIWNDSVIDYLEYRITLDSSIQDNSLVIPTHILDSIFHYKDIHTIKEIEIDLIIENQSPFSYSLKNISVVDDKTSTLIKDISFHTVNQKISFILTEEFFKNYQLEYKIQLEFQKQ